MLEGVEAVLAAKFVVVLPHLDERQRRLLLGAEARVLGHGGIRVVARAAGVSESTVSRGVGEVDSGGEPSGRVRQPGGGRKRLVDLDPGLRPALLALVEPDVRGDPMSPLRWTTRSTRKLATELVRQGFQVSADTVAWVLRDEGFSLQGNAKTLEGRQHPDRDAQFRHISDQAKAFQAAGDAVISVDAKKKELVGQFHNSGREWRPAGEPVSVNVHDFPGNEGKAIPYGIYDVAANTGWVNVGVDHDTAAFAVESIRRWWNASGACTYPHSRRLLITADCGGSNGYHNRSWKNELAALAAQTGLAITVCHLPPGTSKWNKIEHRLFSHITMNWRGRPLSSHEVIVNTIAATTTGTGLRVRAGLDTGSYPIGVKVDDQQMTALPIIHHDFHGEWNYTLHPAADGRIPQAARSGAGHATWNRAILSHPTLTGMAESDLDLLVAKLAGPWQDRVEQQRRDARGTDRLRAPGAGARHRLDLADRLIAAVLHERLALPQPLLARLFGVDRSTISRTLTEIRPLLAEHGCPVTPTTRLRSLADLNQYIDACRIPPHPKIKPAS